LLHVPLFPKDILLVYSTTSSLRWLTETFQEPGGKRPRTSSAGPPGSKTPAGLYASHKWLGEQETQGFRDDFQTTVRELLSGQSALAYLQFVLKAQD